MASAQVQLPHNLHAILKEGDSQIDASCDNLIENLQAGIFLNQNKLKFWVDRLLLANAFDIHAKGLIIYGGHDPSCWQWDTVGAVLLRIDWLDVRGKFPAKNLTPGMVYQVSFVLMMKDGEYGFANHPVNFELAIPNYHETIERKEDLSKLPKNKWTKVRVGEFITSCNMTGNLEISMFEHGPQLKGGLIVNKIEIRPVRRQCQN
ncbi:protein PHLOEM PROTEIN 2-LIKE A1-like isoform X2 [Mangifera indica]|uniref:protein PHLOEM PROTEIN 2-LIKE A1-like isoform X1 n=1 Tax=Mangifera indica TaxID=29780 RepID=UPI001CFA767B|nr:protein PHLOEM PROTEIN 2-LIKE A1-like isoform X1 [Mangifera indica]XP_044496829.1 protein PHLOEM PROTEIN 2-LIKE A1-like isoform X2 [Mangifera indica]